MATANVQSHSSAKPNTGMQMSPKARNAMRDTEMVMLRYYNDMGKHKGNCTWGIGFFAHKGVCSPEELERKVTASSVEIEYVRRVAEAERRVKAKVRVKLTQDQFDGLISFTYNTTNIANDRIYQALNDNDFAAAAKRMSESNKVKVDGTWRLAPGLIKRREEESAPFRLADAASR